MAKRILIGNRAFRKRRGKLVEIPPEWVGHTTHPQSIRKRPSKRNATSPMQKRKPKPMKTRGIQL